MIKQEQLECLELLIENELVVARLYEAYAKRTEGKGEFWMKLSEEEVLHAEWISKLKEEIEEGGIVFKEDRIQKDEVRESIQETQVEVDRVLNTGISYLSHKEELKIALKKESGMLEKKFFEFFKTDNEGLKGVLKKLKEETNSHRKRIEEELKSEKRNS